MQQSLHYRMKNVQFCLYYPAASDETIMPWMGETEDSANNPKYILQLGELNKKKKQINYLSVIMSELLVHKWGLTVVV